LTSAATTESRLLIRGNLENEIASFPASRPQNLAISNSQRGQKPTLTQRLGYFFTDNCFSGLPAVLLKPCELESHDAYGTLQKSFDEFFGDHRKYRAGPKSIKPGSN